MNKPLLHIIDMNEDILNQINQLSPEKRQLLEMLMQEEATKLQTNYVAPRTAVEETLANIWADVLKLKQVGIHDNFIEVGGDSIQSIKIAARAMKLGIKFTINQIFDYPTIAELATVANTSLFNTKQQPLTTTETAKFLEAELSQAELNQILKKHHN